MNGEAAGRVAFYDSIAAKLLQLHPGDCPKLVMLTIRIGEFTLPEQDKISLAKAICRFCSKRSNHIQVYSHDQFVNSQRNQDSVLISTESITSKALQQFEIFNEISCVYVIIGCDINDRQDVVEISFSITEDRDIIVSSLKELFYSQGLEYDTLAESRYKLGGFDGLARSYDLFKQFNLVDWNNELDIERFCHAVSSHWIYDGKRVGGERVYRWIRQFRDAGYTLEACQLLAYLRREGYVTTGGIVRHLQKLVRDCEVEAGQPQTAVLLQPSGKSEYFLSYPLRTSLHLISLIDAINNARKSAKKKLYIVFDDAIVSGTSILKYLFEPSYNKNHDILKYMLSEGTIKLNILSAYADTRGVEAITTDSRCSGNVKVTSYYIFDKTRRVFDQNTVILTSPSRNDEFKQFCIDIGKKTYPKHPLGWCDAQWCLVLEYSVPNGTLPILWASSADWEPLFPRKRGLPQRK